MRKLKLFNGDIRKDPVVSENNGGKFDILQNECYSENKTIFLVSAGVKEDLNISSDKEKVPELPRKDVEMGINRQHSTSARKPSLIPDKNKCQNQII